MKLKISTHNDHLEIIDKAMSLSNKVGIHHNTICTNGIMKVRVIDLCYNEDDDKFYYAYVSEHYDTLVKEYDKFIQEYTPCEE